MPPFIEPGIEPLVKAINQLDCARTVYSCEGHFDGSQNEKFLPTAYVTFGVSEMRSFVPLYERLVEFDRLETETRLGLTYDCVLGRFTLSIWAGRPNPECSQKRSVVDRSVTRLSEMICACLERASSSSGSGDDGDGASHPCREPVPPCTLVIPPKEPVCPFTDHRM